MGLERLLVTCLLALASAACAAASSKTGLPDFVVPDCLGVNIHFTGSQDEQVEHIAEAGFRYIRMDVIWSHVEKTKGQYDLKGYEELVDSLSRRSIRPLFILCYGNPLYDEGKAPHTDEGRRAFVAFVKATAERFKGKGILWEIWNEPNLGQFWRPEASVEDYLKLAKLVYAALKEADPGCTVLAPALSGWDFGFLEKAFKLGLLECTDVVSLHAYGSAIPEDAARYYATVRALISKYAPKGKELPIVSGEWGYTAVGMKVETQGEYLARCFLTNLMNDARVSIWYDWHDDGPDPKEVEHHFGTVYLDYKEKPAYHAMRTLSTELAGYAPASRISAESDQDYLALFRKGDDYRLAAWTTGQPHKAKIPVDVPRCDVVALTGERTSIDAKDGALEVELSGAVKYIEPLQPSKRWALEAEWKVRATAVWDNGKLMAEIASDGPDAGGSLKATGKGLGKTEARGGELRGDYVWDGESRPHITVSLTAKGTDRPLVRVVEIDTSACPSVEVLPPSTGELAFAIRQPASGAGMAFKGKLVLGNYGGIRPARDFEMVDLRAGESQQVVRLKTAQEPSAVYSFACKLVDESGRDVVRLPAKRYSVVEAFAGGNIGDAVSKYACELDGDPKVPAKASLTYAKAPGDAPGDVCARLDYEFDTGWRFVRVSPRPMTPIPERPRWAKLWIKGDGHDGLARLRVADSEGQTFQPDYGRLNFSEWRCLTAEMTGEGAGHWGGANDGIVRYPVSWDTLFLLDSAGGRKASGVVYLGPLMLCYD